MFWAGYAAGRGSKDDGGGGLLGLLALIWFFTKVLPLWIAEQFHNFYVWSEPFRTLFFQDFFYSTALYLLPIGVLYTVLHLVYGDKLEPPIKTILIAVGAALLVGVCRLLYRINTGNWSDYPDMETNPFIGLLWLPVLLVNLIAYITMLFFGSLGIVAMLYIWLSRLGNWISDYIADKLEPEVVYIPPTPMGDYDKAVYNAGMHAIYEVFPEIAPKKPERRPFHNTLFIVVCVPIYTFFTLWLLFCIGGCVYLLI